MTNQNRARRYQPGAGGGAGGGASGNNASYGRNPSLGRSPSMISDKSGGNTSVKSSGYGK